MPATVTATPAHAAALAFQPSVAAPDSRSPTPAPAKDSIAWATDLPALPAAVADLLALVADDDLDVDELCARLSVDMALTAKILRLANSSFYGARGPVTSVDAAVGRVGLRMIKGIVTAAAVGGAIRPPVCPGFDFAVFWRDAVATATAAQMLALSTGADASTAFTAGLLLRIGQLVLASQAPGPFAETLARRVEFGGDAIAAERRILGIDHTVIGAKIATHWRLPAKIVEALGQRQPPLADGGTPDLGQIVNVAGRLVQASNRGGDAAAAEAPGEAAAAWAAAGVPADFWIRTAQESSRQAETISGALAG